MVTYAVEGIDTVQLAPGSPYDGMDLMSSFVWREAGEYRMLVRAVPNPLLPTSPTGIIGYGRSADGTTFAMDDRPAIAPQSDPQADDAGGCEDPTVLIDGSGRYLVYYTGVDAGRRQGAMMVAEGASFTALTRRTLVLKAPPGEGNIKEATIAQAASGDWRLFYEYAANEASRIGMAEGPSPDGPWTVLPDPFTIRDDSWDDWHLSTGPIVNIEGQDPVMLYNGATHDARWRIGWISFDRELRTVTGRGIEPLILPPPATDRAATDIAFAASAIVETGGIHLYFSLEDRILRRALVRCYDHAV